jgi:dipeptidase
MNIIFDERGYAEYNFVIYADEAGLWFLKTL